jgi:type II secretory pathway predicted ATPase ExeA
VLEKRTLVLIIDEAQNLSDENLEALRLLLNYHVPQRKLLNILLFGQGELEKRIHDKGNLADRVDGWIRLNLLDDPTMLAILDYRLTRAGVAPGTNIFTPEARELLAHNSGGIPRRLTMIAHLAMQEAADRASTLVVEDHVRASLLARGIAPKQKHAVVELVGAGAPSNGTAEPVAENRGFFSRLFGRSS